MEIKFGCGGGFTGEVDGCRITGDGQIFTYSMLKSDQTSYGKISKSELKKIDKMISEKGFYEINEDMPANMTCFIEILNSGKTEKIYRWPMDKSPSDVKVGDLYTYLKALRSKYVKP